MTNNINQNGNFHTSLSPMRFQSSMGKEVRRRYKDGKNVVRLSLARVIKVNYKYNTVDVVTIQHKNSTIKNPNDNGRYSARLPVQFGGQTPDNKIFGTNTLVTVGALVLVGFLEGNKDTPIVLNIYGDVDNQSMLTRTTYTAANESDEELQAELWQLFTLYPSMTYRNIDGHGNQEITFPGKTFLYASADDDRVNDAYFDYDHLPSAYYANGDLIEPTVENAPNMLYVHQSVFGDHRVTFFIKSDGTVRVGSRHADGKGVTFWQMNTDGSFKIQQSNDTVDPENESSNFSSFSIEEDGDIILQAGSNILSIGKDGMRLNGGSVSGSNLDLSSNQTIKDILGDIYTLQQATTVNGIVQVVTESTPWQNLNNQVSSHTGNTQTFISQPVPPYNIGDVWKNGSSIYICVTPKAIGATFDVSDWSLSADITSQNTAGDTASVNGTPAHEITTGISTAQSTAQSKTEMFLSQPTPPYNKGDIWNNNGVIYTANITRPDGATFIMADWDKAADITANNTSADTAKVNGTPAIDITTGITNAQNTADSKARTFTATPTVPYSIGDMWNQSGKIYSCTFPRAVGASFNALDWVLVADMTSLNTAADTAKVNGVDAATVTQQAANGNTANTNFNNYTPGGRNYIKNTSSFKQSADGLSITNWSLLTGSSISATMALINDATFGTVIDVKLTANATSNNALSVQNNSLTLTSGKFTIGNVYTISFYMKSPCSMTVGFMDSDGTNPVAPVSTVIPPLADWERIVYTFTATATGNVPVFYLALDDTTNIGDILLNEIQLEDGPKASGYHMAPEDINDNISTVESSVNNVLQGTFPTSMGTALVSTVTGSDTYLSSLNSKANSSDLANYATGDQLAQGLSSATTYTDNQIAGIDFSPYVTTSSMSQTKTDITAQFTASGGVNMLKNSVGHSFLDDGTPSFWTVTAGTPAQSLDPTIEHYGASSGFMLNGATMNQTVTVTPGEPYTISAIVFKGATGTGYIKIYDTSTPAVSQEIDFADGTAYTYQKVSIDITPATSTLVVELNGDATSGGVLLTCVMLNIGTQAFTWQQAVGEVYNTNVNFDLNGIRVMSTDKDGKMTAETVMTPDKFAGYSDINGDGVIDVSDGSVDEIFRMAGDSFSMKNATIGPVKIVQISGTHTGIAFIPNS